jgi:hypothetical protein
MNDFRALIQKINEINDTKQEANVDVYKPIKETTAGTAETKKLLTIINELEKTETGKGKPKPIAEKKQKTEEDIVGDLRSRFSDFLKAEVAQGSDLATISDTVQETTTKAQAIDKGFNAIFRVMESLLDLTSEGNSLTGAVLSEGGDGQYIADANEKLALAMEALQTAHMYSAPREED